MRLARLLIGSIGSIGLLVVLVVLRPSMARAIEGTLELKADVATFSGTFTQAGNQPIRTAFGPLRLDYKSGPNAWTTGLLMREGDGNVTIGAGITSADFNSASKLRVLGVIESTTGGVKFPDGTTQTTAVSGAAGLAQGSIVFYDGTSCPTGYAEVTGARGRYIVGLPAAGTLAGTAGTALSNVEDRAVGQHTHAVDPSSTSASITDPGHTHPLRSYNSGGTTESTNSTIITSGASSATYRTTGGEEWWDFILTDRNGQTSEVFAGNKTTGITASVDIAAFNSANAGSVAGTNAPYVQYIVCKASDGAGSSGNGWNDLGTTVVLATSTDSVGIGTTSVTSKLTVAGTVESTTGGFKFPDATTQTSAATGMTSGMIAFFAAACPSGWTEYTAARGLYIVGNPLSGTLATAVGTALTNLENRAVGQHLHSVDPASTATDSQGAHTHNVAQWNGGGGGRALLFQESVNTPYGSYDALIQSAGAHTHSVDIAAFNSANAGSVAGTNAPYIQLTACQKN